MCEHKTQELKYESFWSSMRKTAGLPSHTLFQFQCSFLMPFLWFRKCKIFFPFKTVSHSINSTAYRTHSARELCTRKHSTSLDIRGLSKIQKSKYRSTHLALKLSTVSPINQSLDGFQSFLAKRVDFNEFCRQLYDKSFGTKLSITEK